MFVYLCVCIYTWHLHKLFRCVMCLAVNRSMCAWWGVCLNVCVHVFWPVTMHVIGCEYVGVPPPSHQGCSHMAHPCRRLAAAWQQQDEGTRLRGQHPEPSGSARCPDPKPGSAACSGKAPWPLPGSEGGPQLPPLPGSSPHPRAPVHWVRSSRVGQLDSLRY